MPRVPEGRGCGMHAFDIPAGWEEPSRGGRGGRTQGPKSMVDR